MKPIKLRCFLQRRLGSNQGASIIGCYLLRTDHSAKACAGAAVKSAIFRTTSTAAGPLGEGAHAPHRLADQEELDEVYAMTGAPVAVDLPMLGSEDVYGKSATLSGDLPTVSLIHVSVRLDAIFRLKFVGTKQD